MDEVKLLGIKIDKQLISNSYVSDLCKKRSRQLNVIYVILQVS